MVSNNKQMQQVSIYHEKQARQLCALHALNNLFQSKQCYSKEQLDNICNNLSPDVWINPHRSVLGLGNYDINVIMSALQEKNCEAIWFDKRKDPACINTSEIVGFILNIPSDYKFGIITLPLRKRHWIAIRKIDEKFYNLDSKLDTPLCIGDESELFCYLRSQLETNERELFIVIQSNTENPQKWLNDKAAVAPTTDRKGD